MITGLSELLREALSPATDSRCRSGASLSFVALPRHPAGRFGDRLHETSRSMRPLWTRWCRTSSFSRSSRTPFATGSAPAATPGAFASRAQADHDALRIDVEDDGAGLKEAGASEGIGLGNTRKRLEEPTGRAQVCGPGDPRGGAIVTVTIPLHARP